MHTYRINVTQWHNGHTVHWFRVEKESNTSEDEVSRIAKQLRCLPDAADVTVTRWSVPTGETLSL